MESKKLSDYDDETIAAWLLTHGLHFIDNAHGEKVLKIRDEEKYSISILKHGFMFHGDKNYVAQQLDIAEFVANRG